MTDAATTPATAAGEPPVQQLDLYVAGDTLHSRRAIDNLRQIAARLGRTVDIRIIDVMQEPKAAFARGIFATPSLLIGNGQHGRLVIGDLSDHAAVLASLAPWP